MTERSEETRQAMRRLWAQLRATTRDDFAHDGLVYPGVIADAVTAYVAWRFEGVSKTEAALIAVLADVAGGNGAAVTHADDPDWLGWRVARAWSWALRWAEGPVTARAAA